MQVHCEQTVRWKLCALGICVDEGGHGAEQLPQRLYTARQREAKHNSYQNNTNLNHKLESRTARASHHVAYSMIVELISCGVGGQGESHVPPHTRGGVSRIA